MTETESSIEERILEMQRKRSQSNSVWENRQILFGWFLVLLHFSTWGVCFYLLTFRRLETSVIATTGMLALIASIGLILLSRRFKEFEKEEQRHRQKNNHLGSWAMESDDEKAYSRLSDYCRRASELIPLVAFFFLLSFLCSLS